MGNLFYNVGLKLQSYAKIMFGVFVVLDILIGIAIFTIVVGFFDGGKGVIVGFLISTLIVMLLIASNYIVALFLVGYGKMVESSEKQKIKKVTQTNNTNISNLVALKNAGLLSEEEFEKEKATMISDLL